LKSFLTFLTTALILKQLDASDIFPVTTPWFSSNIKSFMNNALLFAWTLVLNLNSLSIFLKARDSTFLNIFKDTS
jgi:hypothetical protein